MRILFIYEALAPPYDEGLKKLSYEIYLRLRLTNTVRSLKDIDRLSNTMNSLLIVPRIVVFAFFYRSERIVYIPKQSLTFNTFVKILILMRVFGNRIVVVGLQKKKLEGWQGRILRRFKWIPLFFVLSSAMAKDLEKFHLVTKILPLGIDVTRFKPYKAKYILREKYKIPKDIFVLLHVGHINRSRNIHWFKKVQESFGKIQVLIIGSTSTEQDERLFEDLTKSGVLILREVIPDIQEIYQLVDCYCFPVLQNDGAMEVPLSVIESMATNLPVITTPFGRLPELFKEDRDFIYIRSEDDLLDVLGGKTFAECDNRKKIGSLSWDKVTDSLLS